jgi:dTDP-4-dehydrorhamnose reductase
VYTPQRVAVFGAAGQVGRALLAVLGARAMPVYRADAPLHDAAALVARLDAIQPDLVINAAAYTQVDLAEDEQKIAYQSNAQAPGVLARWCAARNVPFVHYSTDYVFDGASAEPYAEDAITAPLNVYGASKLAGEQAVADAGGDYLIFRTSWVFDAVGKNFFTTMLRLGAERAELRVVADQYGAPSYAPHLAAATVEAVEKAWSMAEFPSGIYNLTNSGHTSWHGFAEAIFTAARAAGVPLAVEQVVPLTTAEYGAKVARPANSRLSGKKINDVFGIRLPLWSDAMKIAMEIIACK